MASVAKPEVCISTAARKLNHAEIELLEALTGQIGVAIENSDLYEAVQLKVHELQAKTLELERATPHAALRRTCLTWIKRLGFGPDAMDRMANHKTSTVTECL